jgi:hypothetical protein
MVAGAVMGCHGMTQDGLGSHGLVARGYLCTISLGGHGRHVEHCDAQGLRGHTVHHVDHRPLLSRYMDRWTTLRVFINCCWSATGHTKRKNSGSEVCAFFQTGWPLTFQHQQTHRSGVARTCPTPSRMQRLLCPRGRRGVVQDAQCPRRPSALRRAWSPGVI